MASITSMHRPDAPYDLPDDEAEVWRATVDALPADWFSPETHKVLSAYCRHAVSVEKISRLIYRMEQGKELDVPEYERLLKMRARESMAMSALATRMRITQQSTYDRKKSKAKGVIARPWEAA